MILRSIVRFMFRLLLKQLSVFSITLCSSMLTSVAQMPEQDFPELAGLIAQVRQQAPEYQRQQDRLDEAEGERIIARSHTRPRVHAWSQLVGAYEIRDDIDNRTRAAFSANINLSQPLWHWGSIQHQQEIHRLYAQLIETDAMDASEGLLMQVREHWLQWLVVENRLQMSKARAEALEENLRGEQSLLEAGQSTPERLLERELELSELQDSILRQQWDSERIQNQLQNWVGNKPSAPSAESRQNLMHLAMPNQPMVEAVASPAEENAPATRRAALQVEMAERQTEILSKALWPKFNLVAGVSQDELDAVNQDSSFYRWNTYIGVRMDWPIFDGSRTRGEQLKAQSRLRQAERQQQMAKSEFRNQIAALQREMQLHRRQAETRSLRLQMAERRLELAQTERESGLPEGLQVSERKRILLDIQQQALESRVAYTINRMHLERLTRIRP